MSGIKLPTAAERLRSLLAAASSLTLHVPGHRSDLVGRHRVDEAGRIVLELPEGSHAAHLVRAEPDLASALELTDLTATPVVATGNGRVRSRATFSGWLTPRETDARAARGADAGAARGADAGAASGTVTDAGELFVVMELGSAALQDPAFGPDEVDVDPAAFANATPDPLAEHEADLLCHLLSAHPDAVERLSRLIPPHHLHGVRRILPVRMDRFGLVLRLEFASRARDVQLAFTSPVKHASEAGDRMQELLARARCCRHGH
ncbi:DUF2470 domain-containing protein [Dactylosporangium sp. AC04546]|uniref:DUF2470 domain-containing protein n=1 Tax=Dactylosporangium sp. AC04546 TaxID=2862460 RepID=UPI002E7B096C|nr:DUF2470 domain-containing protein [Dactylosporangium sp. AC04546]WVK84676.1 DUF2470 domain-containing protein [Dactylosporangium sp. AC04546]